MDRKQAAEYLSLSSSFSHLPLLEREYLAEALSCLCPGLAEQVGCPEQSCCMARSDVFYLVQHLNDEHEWDYARIADWLEQLGIDLTVHPLKGEDA